MNEKINIQEIDTFSDFFGELAGDKGDEVQAKAMIFSSLKRLTESKAQTWRDIHLAMGHHAWMRNYIAKCKTCGLVYESTIRDVFIEFIGMTEDEADRWYDDLIITENDCFKEQYIQSYYKDPEGFIRLNEGTINRIWNGDINAFLNHLREPATSFDGWRRRHTGWIEWHKGGVSKLQKART
jgi:hypothetical protein